MQQISIDYYIQHPREKEPLIKNAPIFNKNNLLLEEAVAMNPVFEDSTLYGCTSASLFTLSLYFKTTVMLLPKGMSSIRDFSELGNSTGLYVIEL